MPNQRINLLIALALMSFAVLGCSALARKVIPGPAPLSNLPKTTPVFPDGSCVQESIAELRANGLKEPSSTRCYDISGPVQGVDTNRGWLLINTVHSEHEEGALFKFQLDRKDDLFGLTQGQNVVVRAVCCDGYATQPGQFYFSFRFARIMQ